MSTKKAKRVSVMQALETAVLALESHGQTEDDIFRYVHLILLGLIRNGELTPEYIELADRAQQDRLRDSALAQARDQAEIRIVNTSGRPLQS